MHHFSRDSRRRGGGGSGSGNRPPDRRDPPREMGRTPSGRRPPENPRGPNRPMPPSGPRSTKTGIDSFELFCAYHLGIRLDKTYKASNIHDVAQRFGVDAGMIRQALRDFGMDPETLFDTEFDMTMAQVDIQVAPPGVDRIELARSIFEEFLKAPRKKRDWQGILADDARENAKIFGRKS